MIILLFPVNNAFACSVVDPFLQKNVTKIIATDYTGQVIDEQYLKEFRLGAMCEEIPPPYIRTVNGELIVEDPRNQYSQLGLTNGKLVFDAVEFNLSFLKKYRNEPQTISGNKYIHVDFKYSKSPAALLKVDITQKNLIDGSETNYEYNIRDYLIGTGFNFSTQNYTILFPSNSYLEHNYFLTTDQLVFPLSYSATNENNQWFYTTWIININVVTGEITHQQISESFRQFKYVSAFSIWEGNFVMGYKSNNSYEGIHIFDENLNLIENIYTLNIGFDLVNEFLLYELQDRTIIYNLKSGTRMNSSISLQNSIISKDFAVTFKNGLKTDWNASILMIFIITFLSSSIAIVIHEKNSNSKS